MGRSKEYRMDIIDSGSPLGHHSLNQRWMSFLSDGEVRLFGNPNNKARKAQKRKDRHAEFLKSLPRFQFERSLRKLIEGRGIDADKSYVGANIPKYAKHAPKDLLPPDNDCDITVVNLSPIGREKEPRFRINLLLPPFLDDELGRLGEELGIKKTELTRTLLGAGLELYEAATDPKRGVYFQEPGEEPQKVLPII